MNIDDEQDAINREARIRNLMEGVKMNRQEAEQTEELAFGATEAAMLALMEGCKAAPEKLHPHVVMHALLMSIAGMEYAYAVNARTLADDCDCPACQLRRVLEKALGGALGDEPTPPPRKTH